MRVLEVMRVHVNKLTPDATLPDAVDIMDLYQVVCVPVVDADGRPVGVVTEGDIKAALLTPYTRALDSGGSTDASERAAQAVANARALTVEQFMSAPAVCVADEADVEQAAQLMEKHGYARLPVTSDGRVVGTIGRIDVCQALLDTGA